MLEQTAIIDDVVLTIDGNQLHGWKDVTLERSLDRASGGFSLSLTDDSPQLPLGGEIMAGKACQITFGGDLVLDGWVDAADVEYDATHHGIRVSGRDRMGDLLDCAATIHGPFEYRNVKLEQVVSALAQPFGIKVTVAADTGAPFKRFSIQPGETAFEAIERACRQRAILPLSDGIGGLALVLPGINDSGESLTLGENILRASASDDWRDRFSTYVFKGHDEAVASESADQVSLPQGIANDTHVGRYRPSVTVAEAQGDNLTLKERAAWQAKINRARSSTATYTVQGWRGKSGALWALNSIVTLNDQWSRRTDQALVSAIRMTRGSQGTTTELTVVPPDAFTLPAEAEQDGAA